MAAKVGFNLFDVNAPGPVTSASKPPPVLAAFALMLLNPEAD